MDGHTDNYTKEYMYLIRIHFTPFPTLNEILHKSTEISNKKQNKFEVMTSKQRTPRPDLAAKK